MTHEESTAVHIASKPANIGHQYWPKAVVESFLAAELVTQRTQPKTQTEGFLLRFWSRFGQPGYSRRLIRGM